MMGAMHKSSNFNKSSIFDNLVREKWAKENLELYKWEGFWYAPPHLKAIMEAQSHFKSCNSDIILASPTKAGTTWLKSLIPCVVGHNNDDNLGLDVLIPSLESQNIVDNSNYDVFGMLPPRLFQTHVPYSALPESIKSSECKIVYVTRNTEETFMSLWRFLSFLKTKSDFDEKLIFTRFLDKFCEGVHPYGPFHDHVLEYWNESLKRPGKVLFMRYDEMIKDPKGELKKLALFLGRPFKSEEEVRKLWWKCSLKRLKSLEVKRDEFDSWVGHTQKKDSYFRRRLIRGWKIRSLITREMKERLDEVTCAKFDKSGLQLRSRSMSVIASTDHQDSFRKISSSYRTNFATKFLQLRLMVTVLFCLLACILVF